MRIGLKVNSSKFYGPRDNIIFLDNYLALTRYLCRPIGKWMAEICQDINPTKTVCNQKMLCQILVLGIAALCKAVFLVLKFVIPYLCQRYGFQYWFQLQTYFICRRFSHMNPNFISKKLGAVLKRCSQWLVNNTLSLNLGKTECILFGTRKKPSNEQHFYIKCNDYTIASADKWAVLVFLVDQFLSAEYIFESIVIVS